MKFNVPAALRPKKRTTRPAELCILGFLFLFFVSFMLYLSSFPIQAAITGHYWVLSLALCPLAATLWMMCVLWKILTRREEVEEGNDGDPGDPEGYELLDSTTSDGGLVDDAV